MAVKNNSIKKIFSLLKMIILFLLFTLLVYCRNYENSKIVINLKDKRVLKLPSELNEISGICFSDEGKLFGHNDEKGIIYQIDIKTGNIIKSFQLGNILVEADFEDIAFVNDKFYMITSSGVLYEFREGDNFQNVRYNKRDLRFSSKFDIEGLCYDNKAQSLLIACKEYPGKNFDGYRAIYSYSLISNEIEKDPRFLISLKQLKKEFGITDFYPSAITQNQNNGNFYILTAKGKPALIEMDESGKIIEAIELSRKMHPQPESLAINSDFDIIIGDEKSGASPKLTIYLKGVK